MRQFDIYENPSAEARRYAPYLVVLSSHLLLEFEDAVVAPLVNDGTATVSALEVDVHVDGQNLILVVSELAGIEGRTLARKIGSLATQEDDIRRALDRLFTGF